MTAVNWDIWTDAISKPQADFLDDETNLYPAYVGGYGSGKTYAGCYKALDHSAAHPHGNRGLLVAITYKHVKDIFWPMLFDRILDPAGIPYVLNKSDFDLRFRWGAMMAFRSAEHPHKIVGAEYAYVYLDEPQLMPEIVWKNSTSRVRAQSNHIKQRFVTFTPDQPGWTHDRWGIEELTGEQLQRHYALYQGRTSDNWTLDDEYEEQLLSEWDENEAQARVYGSFRTAVSGRVYHAFTRENVNRELATYDPKRPLWISFDFNERPGMHVVVCQRDQQSDLFLVVGEVYRKGLKLEDSCEIILERYGELQEAPVKVTGDARDSAKASQRGYYQIIKDIFRDGTKRRVGFLCGVMFDVPTADPSVKDSVASTNALLCNAMKIRRLFIHPDCKRVKTDMERLITKAEKAKQIGKVYDGKYGIEKGDENLSHASDCVRYWVARVASLTRNAFKRQLDYRIPNA